MTSSTEARRCSRSSPRGTSKVRPASPSVFFARTMRWAMVGFAGEKGAGDLVGGQPADQAQRQRRARLGRQHRMAGGEDQARAARRRHRRPSPLRSSSMPVSRSSSRSRPISACLRASILSRRKPSIARRLAAAISQAPGFSRHAGLRPFGEGGHQRVLRQLLGQADVAHHPGQAGDQPGPLDPEHRLDRLMGFGRRHASRLGTSAGRGKPRRRAARPQRPSVFSRVRSCSSATSGVSASREVGHLEDRADLDLARARASGSGSASPTRPPRPCP